ncbi:S1 RNA-binding domain-containing protein [Photobacterium galatheae]|uniref:S1 RNA-binding domain-containing protein n=1 Tax=Photobacterium galatheae TaxID=1654360 RepID=UPI00202CB2B6|nr:S1 RNA-binding domain-containing protein [Photobacterium galatheae]MCM0147407.1 S1 RNA-binding domain-containing protein [Photobacterium galatheae]
MIGQIIAWLNERTIPKPNPQYFKLDENFQPHFCEITDPMNHATQQNEIYKGKICRIEPSLEAAFVEIGAKRSGFLPQKEVAASYFPQNYSYQGRPNIKEALQLKQPIIVQVAKAEEDNKGSQLTTFVMLESQHLLFYPTGPAPKQRKRQRYRQCNRQRLNPEDSARIKSLFAHLQRPPGTGLIAKPSAVTANAEILQQELNDLIEQWNNIQSM